MSSFSFRKPEFRLHLGYPDIVLTSAGRTLGRAATEAADFRSALGRLAEVVRRARGRLVAVLPEGEVWRGRLDLAGRDRTERRSSARMIVAGRLGTTPDDVTVVLGARDAGGSFPVAGVRRSTLLETRALLGAFGLRPSAIVGAGLFSGFAAAPLLGGGWRWPLPALPPHRRGIGAALGAGAVATLAILVLGAPNPPAPVAGVPVPAPPVVIAEAPVLPVEPPRLAAAAPRPPSLALHASERPKPRPAAVRAEPLVTVATRNMPSDLPLKVEPRRLAKPAPAPVDTTISAPLGRPAPLPAPEVKEIARTAMPVLPAPAAASELRPPPRPQAKAPAAPAPASAMAAKPTPASASAALAPRPRAQAEAKPSPAAVLVASLEPAPFAEATLAAAAAATVATALETPPPARPKGLAAPAPAKSAAKPAPVAAKPTVVRPKPVAVIRPKPVSVQPLVKQAVPQRQVVVASAAPQRLAPAPAKPKVVAVAPKPVRQKVVAKPVPVRQVAKAAPAKPKQVQVAAKPVREKAATQRVGLSRGNISLVGVFASSDGRTALVRLPNGNIEKVKAGDRVQGVQVAAISTDSVRLTGRGKDTLLRLPD